jgi:hypothetical protein
MKPVVKYAWPLFLTVSIAFWMGACGKKQDEAVNAKIRGNIATDGLTASSESTINGQMLRISVNRILVSQGAANGSGNWGWTNPSAQSPVVSIDVSVNGTPQTLQYQINPYSFNSGNSWQWTGANTMMAANVAGFQLWYEARCDSLICENMWVNLVFSSYAYGQVSSQVKQIGLYRINSQNRLAAAFESTTGYNQTIPTNQLIQELNAISQQ